MRTFIQVVDAKVHWKFEAEANPYPPNVDIRDVTDAKPMPEEGWDAHEDGTYTAPVVVPAPVIVPQPNTPGNPYFGKKPKLTKDFYALVGQTLPADRFKRLLNDSHFLWVGKVLDHVEIVDPDDKAGQFLQIVGYLVGTAGDDAGKLMTAAERDAIMNAWG